MSTVEFDFTDRTVVVTGGSSGIGREMAVAFAAAGATVLIADVREEPRDGGAPTRERIEDDGGTAAFVETDVSAPAQIEAAVEAAREYGGVDVMVNNAGIVERTGLLDVTPEAYDRVQAVNARGVLFGCKYAAADMIERGEPGVVLNTASINSEVALYEHVSYDASKGAVKMITRNAALELSEHDVRVNAIAPGYTATQISEGGPDAIRNVVAEGKTLKPVPLGRAGEADEVAACALFLCSDAASYVTGEVFHVDGGYQVL